MKLIGGLNSVRSQVWAIVLILLGLAAFGIACKCSLQDVRSALINAGSGLIGGALLMMRHDATEQPSLKNETTSTDAKIP